MGNDTMTQVAMKLMLQRGNRRGWKERPERGVVRSSLS